MMRADGMVMLGLGSHADQMDLDKLMSVDDLESHEENDDLNAPEVRPWSTQHHRCHQKQPSAKAHTCCTGECVPPAQKRRHHHPFD